MKKLLLLSALALGSGATITSTLQSCTSIATSNIGLSIIKQVLLSGISYGMNTYSNKEAFLKNNLIDQAMPSALKNINNIIGKISPNLVQKEKEYIAETAAYTVDISGPILKNAVNNFNASDVERVIKGETATQILKEKASAQLVAAISPKVNEKLNQFGIVRALDMALQGGSAWGSILGNNNNSNALSNEGGLSHLVSQQLVNGLFYIVGNYEKDNRKEIFKIFGK